MQGRSLGCWEEDRGAGKRTEVLGRGPECWEKDQGHWEEDWGARRRTGAL